eukprot:scaffold5.g842.t1
MLPAVQSQPGLGQPAGLPAPLGSGGNGLLSLPLAQQSGAPPLQLNESLLASQLASVASTGHSPAGSVSGTPRTASLGPPAGAAAAPEPTVLGGLPQPPARPWSSMDGMPRPGAAGGSGAVSPSDSILHQSQQPHLNPAAVGAALQRPPSTGLPGGPGSVGAPSLQMSPNGSALDLSGSLDGALGRLPPGFGQQQQGGLPQIQAVRAQTMPAGLPSGLTPLQQQQLLLQHQLQLQQRAQSGPLPPPQPQNPSLANLQAAAQAAQAAQQAALRQQFQRAAPQPPPPLPNLGQPGVGGLPGLQGAANQNALYQALLNQNASQLLQQQQQQQNAAALLAGQSSLLQQAAALNSLNRAAAGLTAQQNSLLQGQLSTLALQQQLAAAGVRPAASLGGAGGINPALAAALLGGNAGGLNVAGLQALQQAQQGLQSAQQQLLINQALRANGLQAGLGQRPPTQLQSEALIAMQRQQAALHAQGMRLPGGAGITPDQLQAMAQLGLLKPQAPAVPPANGMTPHQQAALLSALQAGPGGVGRGGLPQQPRPAVPPGLANGAAYLSQARPPALPQQAQPTSQQLLAAALGQRPPGGAGGLAPPARPPSQGGLAPGLVPARPGDGQADPIQTLQDIGKTLAQLNITVEAAVNAGLLGGLSASDVKIVAEAHRQEMEAAAHAAAAAAAPGGGAPGAPASAPGSLGNPTPPLPASPAASHGSAGGGALRGGVARSASDDAFPLDLDEGGGEGVHRRPVDEAALRAKVEQQAAHFDASQYGFFGGGAPGGAPGAGGADDLLGELESEGSGGAAANSGSRPASGAGGAGEAEGAAAFRHWNANLLPQELESRLNLGGSAGAAPGSAPAHLAGMPAAPGGGQQAAGAAGQANLAALWGNAQGDRNDPFGSYLAGLRLGTGF